MPGAGVGQATIAPLAITRPKLTLCEQDERAGLDPVTNGNQSLKVTNI
jgi:hypothetical protein